MHLLDLDARVIYFYRLPSSTAAQDDVLVECIVTGCLGTEYILMDDFSLSTLNWAVDIYSKYIYSSDCKFCNCFNTPCLVQWVTELTISFGKISWL